MHQRTRVMQRNVRMVLILVDGQSTVSDLSLKTGNIQLTENALVELEKGGFVERRIEQDSLWSESKKVAQEIRRAATNKEPELPSPDRSVNVQTAEPDLSLAMNSMFQESTFSFPPMPFSNTLERPATPLASRQIGVLKKSFLRATECLRSFDRRISARFSREGVGGHHVAVKTIRHGGQSTSTSWLMIGTLGSLGLLAALFLSLVFFPYSLYLPDMEAAFSRSVGRPVSVQLMHVDVFPKPELRLGNVRMGTAGKDEIAVAEVRLQPEISSMLSTKKNISDVLVSGLTLPAESIAGLRDVFVVLAKPDSSVHLGRVSLEKLDIAFGELAIRGLDGEIKLSTAGLFESLLLHSLDRSLTFEAKPLQAGLDVNLEALGWRPYPNSPFLFDSLSLKGALKNAAFTVRNMELRIFDGLVQGTAVLGNNLQNGVSGRLVFERLNAARLGEALGIGQQFTGDISGQFSYSMATGTGSWASLFSALNADGEFSIQRGSVRGIDLAEAVRQISQAPVQGGATSFELLSGKMRLTPTKYLFSGLKMNSGLMQSSGHVEISKDLKLNGKMDLQMRGTVNQTRVPIEISGPLNTPSVQLGRN